MIFCFETIIISINEKAHFDRDVSHGNARANAAPTLNILVAYFQYQQIIDETILLSFVPENSRGIKGVYVLFRAMADEMISAGSVLWQWKVAMEGCINFH